MSSTLTQLSLQTRPWKDLKLVMETNLNWSSREYLRLISPSPKMIPLPRIRIHIPKRNINAPAPSTPVSPDYLDVMSPCPDCHRESGIWRLTDLAFEVELCNIMTLNLGSIAYTHTCLTAQVHI